MSLVNLAIKVLGEVLKDETIDRKKVENLLTFLEKESQPKPLKCLHEGCELDARELSNYCGLAHKPPYTSNRGDYPLHTARRDKKLSAKKKNDLAGWFDIIMGRQPKE